MGMARMGQGTPLKVVHSQPASDIQQAGDLFLLDCRARRLTAGTLDSYARRMRSFQAWFVEQGITKLADLSPAHIRAYMVGLQERGLDDDTVITEYRVFRAWLNFCVREELIAISPMKKVKAPRLPKEILPAFSPEDVQKLLVACKTPRDKAIVMCLLDTGCRVSEFVALNIADLDTQRGAIQVKLGKGRKDRVVFLGAKSLRSLMKYLRTRPDAKPGDAIWLSEKMHERLTLWGLEHVLLRLGKRAGVEHANPHTFRRSFALWSLRSGMDIFSLQRLMGHADLTVLHRYLALVEGDLEAAHRQHGAVDSML
jgi:site-specific recombinase XerD